MRFVRAGSKGAKVRNTFDAQGLVVGEVASEGILAVYGERSGWLEVEPPGGLSVWVYGEYVQPTADAGVVQIKGSDVRMRPAPSSGTESMPLRQLLANGEKLRLIGRKDVSKPLSEDWVNVWSPIGARGWVAATETVALPAGSDGAAQWSTAVSAARKSAAKPDVAAKPAGEAAVATADKGSAADALRAADQKMSEERAKHARGEDADFAGVKAAYEAVLALHPPQATADAAKERLADAQTLADAQKLLRELESQKAAAEAANRKRAEDVARAEQRHNFANRFTARGWLERRTYAHETEPVYAVVFGGASVAEVRCTSGRYDLDDYVDCEIGFVGAMAQGPIRSAQPGMSRPEAFDVTRIEIISVRAKD